jgi:Ca2+-binding RTX toxin-like protein
LTRATTTSDGQAYNLYDLDFGGTPVASVSGGNNLIRVSAAANQSISGGSGNDTIDATFGAIGSGDALVDGGVDVITGNGGQDFIIAASPFTEDSNVEPHSEVRIYAGSQVDIPTAIANANSGNGTGQQGDLFDSDVSNATIVGGNGNDLIFDSGADLVIAGSGDDTILSGVTGVYHNTTRLDGSIDA